MRKLKTGFVLVLLAMVLVTYVPLNWMDAKVTYVTIKKFDQMLQDATGTDKTFIKAGQFADTNKTITNEDAAVLASRAMTALGETVDADLYKSVKDLKRISGLSKATTSKVGAIRRCYTWGIMIGTYDGQYTKTRNANPKAKLTTTYAKTICTKIKYETKRSKLSPDGQLIRTTNLPKNYKNFDYVLNAVPNKYYEKIWRWQYDLFDHKPVQGDDYVLPKNNDKIKWYLMHDSVTLGQYWEYSNGWVTKAETNFKTRLTVDYRTITNKNTWLNTVKGTYYKYDTTDDIKELNKIVTDYIKYVKSNKIIIKSKQVYADPSTIYMSNGRLYIRVHAKFMVTNATKVPTNGTGLVLGVHAVGGISWEGLKLDKWYDTYSDVTLDVAVIGDTPDGIGVFNEGISNYHDLHEAYVIQRAKDRY